MALTNPTYDVKPVRVSRSNDFAVLDSDWEVREEIYGWFPAVFGEGWFPGHSVQIAALDHLPNPYRDPDTSLLFESAERAMQAWELSEPTELTRAPANSHFIRENQREAMNEQEVFRHFDTSMELPELESTESEDPDPTLWDAEEISF